MANTLRWLRRLTLPTLMVFCAPALAQLPPSLGVPLPNPNIPGYNFPETEATILNWVNNQPAGTSNIYLHGWGLWTSLTMPSGTSAFGLPNAPVYLTWLSKQELVALSKTTANAKSATETAARAPRTLGLGPATQLLKFGTNSTKDLPSVLLKSKKQGNAAVDPDTAVFETVSYSPDAALWILEGRLFLLSTIQAVYNAGQPEIPVFPNSAVSLKPVYKVISTKNLINGRYYAMPAWPGTPAVTPTILKNGFGEEYWPGCVYVDTQNSGPSTASGIDPACDGPTPATTYGLGDFISIPVNADNIAQLKVEGQGQADIVIGDTLILMAMHVTSREITEWTWQTFFWTPNPVSPPSPSSATIAGARPLGQLKGAAAHYASSVAYQMIAPNQPVNGGNNNGLPVIGYNPYLEADFKASVFGMSVPVVNPQTGQKWVGQVGVQTNCMTCHALAAVAFQGSGTPYATDFYIARNDPAFKGTVQTDFLWSIADVVSQQQTKK